MQDVYFYIMALFAGILLALFNRADERADRMESRYHNVQEQAIDRGYALYCPQDGEFAWVGECEEDE